MKFITINPCAMCGNTEGYIANGQVYCANEICSQPLGTPGVGLIKGRHEMPVDDYLLPDTLTAEVGYHQGAYDAARRAAEEYAKENGNYTLFLTGLTVAGIGAVEGMKAAGIKEPMLMNYDSASSAYVVVRAT